MKMAANRGQATDPAAHMRALAEAGLVMQPCLEPDDERLQPIDGMPFDTYVKLVAQSISKGTSEGLEAAGAAFGLPEESVRPAFEKWGERIVSDPELGTHYTAILQAELAAGG